MCEIMVSEKSLNRKEMQWLQLFWDIDFYYKQELQKQIESAAVEREYAERYIFLKFTVPEYIDPIQVKDERVPLEVLISHYEGAESASAEIQIGGDSIAFILDENKNYPTSFMLHFVNGYIYELEIYNLDHSILNIENIHIGKRNYKISPSLARKTGDG